MKIAQISDIHIRNLRYHDEYREVFKNLYAKLKELDVDLIVNTGDTAHTKVQISPEFVQMASEFFTNLGNIATTFVILGNHDLNLNNSGRLDAISPIVKDIDNVFLLTSSGQHVDSNGLVLPWAGRKSNLFQFWLYDITDDESKHPKKEHVLKLSQKLAATGKSSNVVNVGFFHGSVFGAIVDSGFELVHYEADMKRFSGMDFVMLGDIHKRQSFMNGRAWYPGSLIQQNFGEDPDKGFLLWDIKTKDDFDVTFHKLEGSRGFYTIRIEKDLLIPDDKIPEGARIRAIVDSEITLAQQKNLAKELKEKFLPKDIVSITSNERSSLDISKTEKNFDPNESYRVKLLDYARSNGASEEIVDLIRAIDDTCIKESSEEDVRQNAFWKINSIAWSNLFNYGESNVIDFSKTEGLSGIFAPNGSGKSSLFDVVLQGLFDKITKDAPKNIDLINDNRDLATIVVDLSIGDEGYVIERQIERVKYGHRKFSETKEWGKTTLSFYKITEDGKTELSENGISRSETERQIRRLIGTFDEFIMTSMVSQSPVFGIPGGADIINCKESDRKKILFKFLGLDQFESRAEIAREKLKKLSSEMKVIENDSTEEDLKNLIEKQENLKKTIEENNSNLSTEKLLVNQITKELHEAQSAKLSLIESPETIKKKIDEAELALKEVLDRGTLDLNSIEDLKNEIKKLKDEEPIGRTISLAEISKEKNEAAKKQNKLQSDSEKKLVLIKTARKASETIGQVPCEGKYPTCKFLTDAFNARSSIDEMIEAYNLISSKKQEIDEELSKITDLEIASRKFNEWKITVSVKESELSLLNQRKDLNNEVLRSKQDDLERLQKDLESSILAEKEREKIFELKKGIKKLEEQLSHYRKIVSQLETNILMMERQFGSIESQIEKMKQSFTRLDEIRKKVSAYELYTDAMGKHGIPYVILAGMLPFINEEINRILSQFVGFKVFLEHDQAEQTIRIFIQYNEFKSRSLSLAGGAEKFIASLAIRVALISVSRLPKTNLLIIDEGFGRLDPEMMDSVQRMLEFLKSVFGNVFVVSHVEAMKDMVDTIIEISTDECGYAHIEVI